MGRIVEPVPDGFVFDTSQKVTRPVLQALMALGFRGGVRYVGLHGPDPNDLDAAEVDLFMSEGAGLLVVQHCLAQGWKPTATVGTGLGQTAAALAKAAGYLPGATLYDDLEGIAIGSSSAQIADFANAKLAAVGAEGYPQGQYIGYQSWLDENELYDLLETETYWKSFSLVPDVAVRSYAVRQLAGDKLRALGGFPIDVNRVEADVLGGRPTWMRQAA